MGTTGALVAIGSGSIAATTVGGFTLGTPVAGGIAYGTSTTQVGTTSALTQYGVLFSGGTGAPTSSAQGAANMPLIGQGASNPIFSTIAYPTSGATGGLVYFSSNTAMAASALLNQHGVLLGGGAGAAPYSLAAALTGTVMIGVTGTDPGFSTTPVLGTDNSVAGTLQLASTAGTAHTIIGSAATTTNTVNFFATAPATGAIWTCATATTTCTATALADVAIGSVLISGGVGVAPSYSSTPTLGASGTLGSITMGNATSGLLTIEPTTGAITSYTLALPVAQPSGSNTFLSCTAANPAVCTWTAAGGALTVNGSGAGTNLSDSTPAATAGYVNAKWQISGSNMSGEVLSSAQGSAYSIGTCTTAATIDPANGAAQTMLLTAADACVITITQPSSGTAMVRVRVKQASTPTGTVTWPACVPGTSGACWPGGIGPVMSASASAYDWYSCFLDGTNAWCTAGQNFQ